ncbi:hypothetical protein FBB35_28680 [Nostoc sp. TCL240-02]|nr:hypothetical protein FBB35_28680 [Nostoc sp. TCL240-02]
MFYFWISGIGYRELGISYYSFSASPASPAPLPPCPPAPCPLPPLLPHPLISPFPLGVGTTSGKGRLSK